MEDPATWPHLCSHPHSVDGRTDYQPRRTGLTTASAMPSSSAHRLSAPGGFRLRPVMSQDTTKEKPPRWPAPPTCCRSAPKQLLVKPNDVANKPAGPDEVACNDVGAAGGRPRALGPHPGAQVGEPTQGQLLQGPGRVNEDELQVLREVDAGHEQPAWDKRGASVHGAGSSRPRVRSLTHGVLWPTTPCGHQLTWSPTHVVTPPRGHQPTWSPTQEVTQPWGQQLT